MRVPIPPRRRARVCRACFVPGRDEVTEPQAPRRVEERDPDRAALHDCRNTTPPHLVRQRGAEQRGIAQEVDQTEAVRAADGDVVRGADDCKFVLSRKTFLGLPESAGQDGKCASASSGRGLGNVQDSFRLHGDEHSIDRSLNLIKRGKGSPAEYRNPGNVSPQVLDDISAWLSRR